MKFLIWFGCIVVSILLNAFIGEITGIKAGALIMYIPLVFVPKKLCKLWDEYMWYKKHPEAKEEIRTNFPSDFLNRCEEYRDKDSALRIFLNNCVENKEITEAESKVLFNKFMKKISYFECSACGCRESRELNKCPACGGEMTKI